MYTVASVYVPPSGTLNELAFDRMINSFSSRYLILGDFNGHSHLWGANQENERGKIVEKLIDRHNLILLNDSVHTRFDTYHQTSSLLDLSLCHPSIYMDVACEISSDRLGSDHHPIIITANTSDHPVPERVPKWNFKRAKCTMDLEAHFIWIANEITITFVLMQFMLISNEIQINFISISREIHMNFSRTEREIRTVKLHSNFIWTSCELHINFIWNAY